MSIDIELPDGTIIRNVPEGITRSELMRRVERGQTPQVTDDFKARAMASATLADKGPLDRFVLGAGARANEMVEGIKGLFRDPSQEDLMRNRAGQQLRNQSTAASLGGFGMDAATLAAPMIRGTNMAASGINAASRFLPKAFQSATRAAAPYAAAGGVGAGLGATLSPENRGEAAVAGGVGGVVGEGAGRFLTKALGGPLAGKVTPDARQLMDRGVNVPIWKATESRVARDLAERARVLPVAGDIIRGQERAAFEGVNRAAASKVTPPKPVLDDAGGVMRWEKDQVREFGSDAINALKQRFDNAYDALYKGRGIPVDDAYAAEAAGVLQNVKNYYPRIAGELDGAFREADDILRAGTETTTLKSPIVDVAGSNIKTDKLGHAATRPESVKQAIDALETRIKTAYGRGDAELGDALVELKGSIEALRLRGLPPEVASQAAEINKAYAGFIQLQRANSTVGAQKQGFVSPSQMLNSIRAGDRSPGKSAFARGNALNQQDALLAQRVLGDRLPPTGPGTAEKLLPFLGFGLPMIGADAGATALLGTQTGQRALMGGLPGQAAIRNNKYLIPALRFYGMQSGIDLEE